MNCLQWVVASGLLMCCCTSKDMKFQQYFAQGQNLYETHCSNCHQKNGQGLGRLYPPLAGSDYLKNNFEASICLMKYGTSGEISVKGIQFNKPMPGVPSLTELELAEILTYITNAWGEEHEMITLEQTSQALKNCTPP
ncbi:MAG: hypothetical protein OJF59_001426 [Cytophagales bacterium]|nr:cytochrome c [Bacteroidota bacterium]MBS1980361.1 cytochrome c [Bacteroidota bacterium]WHZ07673.1 MAG: hypothetical protein OJF59_001426 [Cytophagales bacterium]